MTCKDCLHYPACAAMFKRAWGELPETGEGAERCETFADRSYYVVRERGEWGYTGVEDEDWGATWHKWTCSNCGYSTGQNPFGENFCPNCGADMRKGENG